jgi:3-hydroxyacyl-[acyl-carrier-protein] dehydratase
MAQIGLVCLGIFILDNNFTKNTSIALTSTSMDFIKPVYPKEKVTVISEKIYFRFKMQSEHEKNEVGIVGTGEIAGMIVYLFSYLFSILVECNFEF